MLLAFADVHICGRRKLRIEIDVNPGRPDEALFCVFPKINAAQDNAGRSTLELHCEEFAGGTFFNPFAQSHELSFALVWLVPHRAFQIIQGGGADRTVFLVDRQSSKTG
jgi:hypothetical protein